MASAEASLHSYCAFKFLHPGADMDTKKLQVINEMYDSTQGRLEIF